MTIERGVVVIPVTQRGEALLLPDHLGENVNKQEKLSFSLDPRRPVVGYQFPGGGAVADETLEEAVGRELGEEYPGFPFDVQKLEMLPIGTVIDQEKPAGIDLYGVTIYRLVLGVVEEIFLRDLGAIDSYKLLDTQVRPRDRIIRSLYALVRPTMEEHEQITIA